MRSFLKLFLPQRMDAVLLSACFLACCLVITGFRWLPASLGLVFSTAIFWAIGAAAGCRQISWGRSSILIVIALAAWLISAPAFVSTAKQPTDYSVPWMFFNLIEATKSWPISPYLSPLVGLASFAMHLLFAMITDRGTGRLVSLRKDGSQRVRWMTGLAVLMLIIHQVIQLDDFEVNPITATCFILMPAILSFLVSDALTGKWSWLKIAFCFSTTAIVWFALAINSPKFLSAITFLIPVGVALLAAGSGVSRNMPAHSPQTEIRKNPELPSMCPSVWSLLPFFIAVLSMTFARSIYLPALFEFRSGMTFLERLEYSWSLAEFARKTESICENYSGSPRFEFDFASHSSSSALKKADAIFVAGSKTNPSFVRLRNLTTEVETNVSNFRCFYMALDGTLRSKQLEELASTASVLYIENLNVIPGEQTNLSVIQIHLSQMNASQLKAFFDSLDPEMKPIPIQIHSPLTADIWPIIAKASLRFPINVYGTTFDGNIEKLERVPIGKLAINAQNSGPECIPFIMNSRALCDTSVGLYLPLDETETTISPVELKLLLRGAWWRDEADSYKSITDWNKDQLLVYERDETGRPQAILCPFPVDEQFPPKGLENLKVMTLDLRWIDVGMDMQSQTWVHKFTANTFKEMPKLERLSIPPMYSSQDIELLAELPKLKQLEIGLANVPIEQYEVLEKLTSLERLVVWNEPDVNLLMTLSKLKELKQLTFVLPDGYGKTDTLEKDIAKYLPEVKATLVEGSKFKPEIPASFTQHFSRVIEELKTKIAASAAER